MSSKNVVDLRSGRRKAAPAPTPPVSRASARVSPLRTQRRRTRLITLVVLAVIAILLALATSYLSYLPQYSIDSFSVTGTQTLSQRLVARFVDTQLNTDEHPFISPTSILRFNAAALENEIVGFFPRVKSAHVSRASLLATAVTVAIEERHEFARWCPVENQTDMTACYSIDDSGFIYAQADPSGDASSTRKYIFSGGFATSTGSNTSPQANPIGASYAPGHFPGIIAFFAQLQQAGLVPTGATVDGNGTDFSAEVSQGFTIKASFGQDSDTLTRNLQLILSSNALQGKEADIDYIDLRFGDRAYYKLKGADTAAHQATSTASH